MEMWSGRMIFKVKRKIASNLSPLIIRTTLRPSESVILVNYIYYHRSRCQRMAFDAYNVYHRRYILLYTNHDKNRYECVTETGGCCQEERHRCPNQSKLKL